MVSASVAKLNDAMRMVGKKTKDKKQKTRVEAFRTSATEDLASISDGIVQEGNTLSVTLPKQSITTLIINFTKP